MTRIKRMLADHSESAYIRPIRVIRVLFQLRLREYALCCEFAGILGQVDGVAGLQIFQEARG